MTREIYSGSKRTPDAIAYAVATLMMWSAILGAFVAAWPGSYGCATQTGVIKDSPTKIKPEQVSPASTQPTQQTAGIAIAKPTEQTMQNVSASQPVQQNGSVNVVAPKTSTTTNNGDPYTVKLLVGAIVAIAGFNVYDNRRVAKKWATQLGYEAGRERRLANEKHGPNDPRNPYGQINGAASERPHSRAGGNGTK